MNFGSQNSSDMLNMKFKQIIIDLIDRHTLVVEQCFPIDDRERAMRAIDQLHREGRVSRWHHDSGFRYWTAAALKPLSDTSLARSLGIFMFCHSSTSRSMITRDELESYFPKMFRHGLPAGHYIEATPQITKLGNVRVDGGQSKINRIVARTQRTIQKYEQQPGFRELITDGNFELTWIVPTHPKQRRLLEALQPLTGSGVHMRVVSIPELLNVVAHISQPNSSTH